jgi:hypothetical protein
MQFAAPEGVSPHSRMVIILNDFGSKYRKNKDKYTASGTLKNMSSNKDTSTNELAGVSNNSKQASKVSIAA